jgi:DNA polymerase elongation subunit (family B)
MKLEFEEEIYHRFCILSKKRYMYIMMKRDGILQDKVGNKGVLLSRRDNSDVVRDIYKGLMKKIFDREELSQILNWLSWHVLEMFQKRVPVDKFIITKQIGSVGDLPLITDGKGVEAQWVKHVESGSGNRSPEMLEKLASGKVMVGDYTITKLSGEPVERARQLKMKMAKDAIGYYTNSLPAHVALAMKMRSRGVRVDDGVRLEHLITVAGGHTDKMFSKLEDVKYYRRNSRYLRIDYLYYLKQMTKPVDQVLNACYGKRSAAHNFMTQLYKYWVQRTKVVDAMDVKPRLVFVESKSEMQKKEPEPVSKPTTKPEYASITFWD